MQAIITIIAYIWEREKKIERKNKYADLKDVFHEVITINFFE